MAYDMAKAFSFGSNNVYHINNFSTKSKSNSVLQMILSDRLKYTKERAGKKLWFSSDSKVEENKNFFSSSCVRAFTDELCNLDFIKNLSYLHALNFKENNDQESSKHGITNSLFNKSFSLLSECQIRFQVSIMKHRSFILPHTDLSNKVASLMIYLPLNDSQEKANLGTIFWRPKDPTRILGQHETAYIKQDSTFQKLYHPIPTPMQSNRLVVFFRSNTSWHSFDYSSEDLGPRISININFTKKN